MGVSESDGWKALSPRVRTSTFATKPQFAHLQGILGAF